MCFVPKLILMLAEGASFRTIKYSDPTRRIRSAASSSQIVIVMRYVSGS
jgi:hypothetical protein